MCRERVGRSSLGPGPGESDPVPGYPGDKGNSWRPQEASEGAGGAASPRSAVEMEGASCTWLWREMPPVRTGKQGDPGWPGLLTVCLPERRAPARRGRGNPCQVETARLGKPGAGGGDGRLRAGYGQHAGSPAAAGVGGSRGTPADVGRGLPSQAEAGGCLETTLGRGQDAALEPDSWAGESGPRDAGAVCRGGNRGAARLEPARWAPHVWEPAETRACGGSGCRKQPPGTTRLGEMRVG